MLSVKQLMPLFASACTRCYPSICLDSDNASRGSDMPDDYHSKGGKARAQKLSAEERSAIARHAALSRHNKDLPRAIAEGVLMIGDTRISCAVLDEEHGNVRVLTQEGFLTAIGRAPKAKGGEGATVDGKPAFLRAAN